MAKQISWLPLPPINPRLPNEGTLAALALSIMISGKKISHLSFQGICDSYRLAAIVHVLKKFGWEVEWKDGTRMTRKNEIRKIRFYFLDEDFLKQYHELKRTIENGRLQKPRRRRRGKS